MGFSDQNVIQRISWQEFRRTFGQPDTSRAHCAFTPLADTNVVLTLLAHARCRRILEIGTAAGHMTANLAEWSPDDATIFTLGTVAELHSPRGPQAPETPARGVFGVEANHFGKVDKVCFICADSLRYDFRRLGPIEFAFIDGAHDLTHVLSDTRNTYQILAPGGCMVWHDVGSDIPWVEVDAALEQAGLPEPIYHVEGTGVAFLHKRPVKETPDARGRPVTLVWEGPQAMLHSFALVNRAVCSRLIERRHEVSLFDAQATNESHQVRLPVSLAGRLFQPLSRPADIHVRHQWPPDFRPPPAGHWVLMQPWEFGSLPKEWIGPILRDVDEVWTYTHYVCECYLKSGIPAERVHVVPLGIDPIRFHPGIPPLRLRTCKSFKFLFVGGTIARKGIDVLLEAYTQSFCQEDDVCLVIQDMGVGSFYRGQTAERLISHYQALSGGPEIEYIERSMSQEELAALYTACNCLVHPYRGEGFGLPIAEAMASGLPVIVTGYGAALDFCNAENAFLIPAHVVHFPEKRVGDLETVDYPWLAEPDRAALQDLMRYVVNHPGEASARGKAGCAHIHKHFTWDHTADVVEARFNELSQRAIRRVSRQVDKTVAAAAGDSTKANRRSVSLCMIVRNEEDNLAACLSSVAGLVDEMIIVDTGSIDRTKNIAAGFGALVIDFPWVDSFAAARNESLRHATGQWIFWLDGDDRLDQDNRRKLGDLFANLQDENVAYSLKCLCLPDSAHGAATVVDHIRLFRNHPQLRWEYRVHEQILGAVRRLAGEVRFSDVVIHHSGYQDSALRGRKLERDLRLLQLEDADRPDDPFTLFNLGSIYNERGQFAEALPLLRRSLERSHPSDSIVRKLFALIVQCHRQLGQQQEALAACRAGRRYYPDDTELLFTEGTMRRELGDRVGAETCFVQLLQSKPANHFASVDAGLRGYKTRHNLAVLYREQGRLAEAGTQWQAALSEQPDFLPCWLGMAELHLAQGRWDELEQTAQQIETLTPGSVEGPVLRSRAFLARKEFAGAQRLLEETIVFSPQALRPRVVLSHVLLQEGRDWAAAERALRNVLALDPTHEESRQNLALLLRRAGVTTNRALENQAS